MVLGEEGSVVAAPLGLVVDVRGVVVVVARATALGFVDDVTDVLGLEAFVDFDCRATPLTVARRRMTTTTAHNHHLL